VTDTARLDELRARVAAIAAKGADLQRSAPSVEGDAPTDNERCASTPTSTSQRKAGGRPISTHLHDPWDMVRDYPEQRCARCGQEWVLLERDGRLVLFARDYRGDHPAVPYGSKERA
jgi:hypothetical protein